MAAQSKKINLVKLEGEGDLVEANITSSQLQENTEKHDFNVNLIKASAPSRKFVADGFNVVAGVRLVRLLFIQTKIDGVTPRALLDIHVSRHAAIEFLGGTLMGMPDTMTDMPVPFELSNEPDQTVALQANLFRASVGPQGACLDCFYASPFSMQAMKENKGIYMEGVVRVQFPDSVFISLVSHLKSLNLDHSV